MGWWYVAEWVETNRTDKEDGVLLELKNFFKSLPFVKFLSEITGLEIASTVRGEYRKWEKQCYTLVQDCEDQINSSGVDLLFGVHKGNTGWPLNLLVSEAEWISEHGGFTTYLDETTELLTLMPHENTLALVFRYKSSQVNSFA